MGMDFRFDLIFIGLNGSDHAGLETASCLRENNVDTDIIFIADGTECITEAFCGRAFNYLVMPVGYLTPANIGGLHIFVGIRKVNGKELSRKGVKYCVWENAHDYKLKNIVEKEKRT